jgi:hypothetical protein
MKTARDEPDTPMILVFGVVIAILTFLVVLLLQVYFAGAQKQEFERKMVRPRAEEPAAALAEQAAALTGYRWIDQQQGIVAIPIERAMELELQEWRTAAQDTSGAGQP